MRTEPTIRPTAEMLHNINQRGFLQDLRVAADWKSWQMESTHWERAWLTLSDAANTIDAMTVDAMMARCDEREAKPDDYDDPCGQESRRVGTKKLHGIRFFVIEPYYVGSPLYETRDDAAAALSALTRTPVVDEPTPVEFYLAGRLGGEDYPCPDGMDGFPCHTDGCAACVLESARRFVAGVDDRTATSSFERRLAEVGARIKPCILGDHCCDLVWVVCCDGHHIAHYRNTSSEDVSVSLAADRYLQSNPSMPACDGPNQ